MNLKESLEWRYATKAMNGDAISDEKRNAILDAMRMAPTSLGLQPIQFLVIRDPQVKRDITPIFHNQGQIEMSDSVIIICSKLKYDEEWLEKRVDHMSKIRNMDADQIESTSKRLQSYLAGYDDESFSIWAAKQAYIALGFGLVAAAQYEVDSTPMEGFDANALNEYLRLKPQGYQSAVALVLGNRNVEQDYLVNLEKVRIPMEDIMTEM